MGPDHRGVADWAATIRMTAPLIIIAVFIALFSGGLFTLARDGHPLSVIDEHIHFDTAVEAGKGEIPYRGTILGSELIKEWSCGVGHEGGGFPYPCGDPRNTADAIPSGKYSTGYGHYPTYFFAAAGFQSVYAAVTGDQSLLNGFRVFSALTMTLGVVALAVFGWLLGLRGWRLIAATAAPVATSMVVFTGTIVNPTSVSVLTGALIAGTGLLWVQRGRGFLWFALSVAFASSIAVTAVLAAGGFGIAMLIILLRRRTSWIEQIDWRPRWWQLGVLAFLILGPVIAWGRFISARATVSDEALYSFLAPSGKKDILVGAVLELSLLHSPWRETHGIKSQPASFAGRLLHSFSEGAPIWIGILVFGAIVMGLLLARIPRRQSSTSVSLATDRSRSEVVAVPGPRPDLALIAIGTLATIVLYPPALRILNWVNFGFDFPIVDRYSSALTPVLVLLALLLVQNRLFSVILAILSVITALGAVSGAI